MPTPRVKNPRTSTTKNPDMETGIVHQSKHYGPVEVLEYIKANKVRVRFTESGTEIWGYSADIINGRVKDPSIKKNVYKPRCPDDMGVGSIHKSNNYGSLVILKYNNAKSVDVRFILTGTLKSFTAGEIRRGEVKDPYYPKIWGVGFIGEGKYGKTRGNREHKRMNGVWTGILRRTCGDQHCGPYKNATICPEWHNFQNFAEWMQEKLDDGNGGLKEGFDVDKDFTVLGNKHYSPETCNFIPSKLNRFLTANTVSGELPHGVKLNNHIHKFQSRMKITNDEGEKEDVYLGLHNTLDEAFQAYKTAKEEYVKKEIQSHYNNGGLPEVVYYNMIKFRVVRNETLESKFGDFTVTEQK